MKELRRKGVITRQTRQRILRDYVPAPSSPPEVDLPMLDESHVLENNEQENVVQEHNQQENLVSDNNEQENVMMPEEVDNNDDSTPLKRKREPTRNIAMAKERHVGQKLSIEVDNKVGRIVGEGSQDYVSNASCVIRQFAELKVKKWAKLDEVHRENLYRMAADAFDLDSAQHLKQSIYRQLNTQYRNCRYRLHVHFQKYKTKEEALKNCPAELPPHDWIWLCDYFSSLEFKKLSEQNSKNLSNVKTSHTGFLELRMIRKSLGLLSCMVLFTTTRRKIDKLLLHLKNCLRK